VKRRTLLEKKVDQETERAKEFTRLKNKRGELLVHPLHVSSGLCWHAIAQTQASYAAQKQCTRYEYKWKSADQTSRACSIMQPRFRH
jgi:hypothetical protein